MTAAEERIGRAALDDDSPLPSQRGLLHAALALLLLQALLRGWVGLRGFLSSDDYVFEFRAATFHLTDPHYLFDGYNGHLMPGSFVLTWIATRVAPLEIWPAVVMDLTIQAATGAMLFVLLRELFGPRKAILIPFTLFLFTPATLTGFAWWAAAVNQLPAMLGMVTCLYLHVRYLRTGRTRTALMSFVSFLVGLAFFEKVILFAPVVFLFTAMYAVPGTWWQRLHRTLTLHLRVWLVWGVTLLAYVAYYESSVESTVRGSTTPKDFFDLAGTSWRALRVTALGGPWHWISYGGTLLAPDSSGVIGVLSWLVVVGVVLGSAVVYRQGLRAWLPPVGFLLVTAALLSLGRFQIGPIIGTAYRYYAEVALLAALALPLSLLPIVGTVAKGEVTVLTRRTWVTHLRERVPLSLSPHSRLVLVRGTVLLLVLSSTYSTIGFEDGWHDNVSRAYVQAARADLQKAGSDVVLATTQPPINVLGLFPPYNGVDTLLSPLRPRPRFLRTGQTSDTLSVLDDAGHLHTAVVDGIAAQPGMRPGCGWFGEGAAGVTVPMPFTTFDFVWTIRVGYLASEDTRAVVTAGNRVLPVQLKKGPNSLFLQVDGAVSSIRLDGFTPHASVCTDDIKVGHAVPLR